MHLDFHEKTRYEFYFILLQQQIGEIRIMNFLDFFLINQVGFNEKIITRKQSRLIGGKIRKIQIRSFKIG